MRAMGQLEVDITTSSNRQGVNLEKILVSSDDLPAGGIRSSDLVRALYFLASTISLMTISRWIKSRRS